MTRLFAKGTSSRRKIFPNFLRGLCQGDVRRLDEINSVEEERVKDIAGADSLMKISPYKNFKVGLVVTGSKIFHNRIEDTFTPVIAAKLKTFGLQVDAHAGDCFEVTQIVKECHSRCAIYQQVGDCIMPREGIFCRVLHGGKISVGDDLTLAEEKIPLDAAIITMSDRGFHGLRDEDTSGDRCEELLTAAGYKIFARTILPDVKKLLVDKLIEPADAGVGLIVTTGGTGFSIRDCTPEATLEVCTRLALGIAEAMRSLSMQVTRRAFASGRIRHR